MPRWVRHVRASAGNVAALSAMNKTLADQIRHDASSRGRLISFPPASEAAVVEEEARLGFKLPPLLRGILLTIGNGGFGPGKGGTLIGVSGGYTSDFGTLAETYEQLESDEAATGGKWKWGLLPFCEWGCNRFSCVAAGESDLPVYQFDEGTIAPQPFNLDDFLRKWLNGAKLLERGELEAARVINPFTKQASKVYRRRNK